MGTALRFAWEYKGFREWWKLNGELNPDIDPKTLGVYSEIFLKEYVDGEIETHRVCFIMRRKNIRYGTSGLRARKPKLTLFARDSEEFMKYFDPALNPHIDLDTLKQSDRKTKFNFIDMEGIPKSMLVLSFFDNVKKHGRYMCEGTYIRTSGGEIRKPREPREPTKKAKDVPGFAEWFERYKEYNTHVDLDELYVFRDAKTVLHYPIDSGRIKSITLYGLLNRKDIFHYASITDRNLVTYDKDFLEFFKKEEYLNENFDLSNTGKFRTEARLKYLTIYNTIKERRISLFFPKDNEHNFVIPRDSVQKYKDLSDELIRTYFHGDGAKICCNCSNNHFFKVKPKDFLENMGDMDRMCPKCGIGTGAAAIDPDIRLFWGDNEANLNDIPPYDTTIYNFVCPYCGYQFKKSIKYMVLRSPKCSNCQDTGSVEYELPGQDSLPIGMLFAMRRKEIYDYGLQDYNKISG